jgi:hypothetical protein
MKTGILEVIKANKKEIITKGIVLLASIGGLLIAANVLTKNQKPDEDEIFEGDYDVEDGDSDTSSEE